MFALSQSSGSVPVSIDFWKITVKLSAIWLAHFLRIRLGIPSGPDAFDEFVLEQFFYTIFSDGKLWYGFIYVLSCLRYGC